MSTVEVLGQTLELVKPSKRADVLAGIQENIDFIVVDYTHPTAVNGNASTMPSME